MKSFIIALFFLACSGAEFTRAERRSIAGGGGGGGDTEADGGAMGVNGNSADGAAGSIGAPSPWLTESCSAPDGAGPLTGECRWRERT